MRGMLHQLNAMGAISSWGHREGKIVVALVLGIKDILSLMMMAQQDSELLVENWSIK